MSNNPPDNERPDSDPTDELPILLETAVLDPAEHRVATVVTVPSEEETGEYTLRHPALGHEDLHAGVSLDALRGDLEARDAKIAALERDIGRLSGRWIDIERHLAEKDSLIDGLNRTISTQRQTLDERGAAEQRLSTEIADRDSQFNRLLDEIEQTRRAAAALREELAAQQQARQAAVDEIASLRAESAERKAADEEPTETQRLKEELAGLSSYIGNRRAWWDDLEARAASSAARVAELERELEHRAVRQQRAEALAESESARAASLRADLVAHSREVETLERELRGLRTGGPAGQAKLEELRTQLDEATATAARLQTDLEAAARELAAVRAEAARREAEHAAALVAASAPPPPPPAPAFDVLAQLEAEHEHLREELAGWRAESLAQTERLAAASTELDGLRKQLAEAHAQMEQQRADNARLERALIDKDRAIEARDERVATLQAELEDKANALHRLSALDVSLQGLDSRMSERLRREAAAETTPSLICLTSDQPRKYALSKKTMTIGRSSECDIQILTQFVSREHARLTIGRSGVVIEDLGSTNGVFVNSVRIDKHELHHSDLVTVGETQFRFLGTMAH